MTVLLLAEHTNDALNPATGKALSAARELGGEIHVLVAGQNCQAAAETAAQLSGVAKVLVADAPQLEHGLAEETAALTMPLMANYDALVAPATASGKNVCPRVAAALDVMQISYITKEISAGRGFIALATVVFSGLNPLLVLLGGFIFGFFDNLAVWVATMPAVQKFIPWQFIAMAPYAVTLLVVAGVIGRARFPAAIGTPYQRE